MASDSRYARVIGLACQELLFGSFQGGAKVHTNYAELEIVHATQQALKIRNDGGKIALIRCAGCHTPTPVIHLVRALRILG